MVIHIHWLVVFLSLSSTQLSVPYWLSFLKAKHKIITAETQRTFVNKLMNDWLNAIVNIFFELQTFKRKPGIGKKQTKKTPVKWLETLNLYSFFKHVEKASFSSQWVGGSTQVKEREPIAWAPNIFTEMNQPLLEFLPGGYSEDTLNHSSRGTLGEGKDTGSWVQHCPSSRDLSNLPSAESRQQVIGCPGDFLCRVVEQD